MTVTEQVQTLKDNYVTEYNEAHRNNTNIKEDNNMKKLSQEELTLKANKLKLEYMREYRKAHKQQNKQYMKTYWEKKAMSEV